MFVVSPLFCLLSVFRAFLLQFKLMFVSLFLFVYFKGICNQLNIFLRPIRWMYSIHSVLSVHALMVFKFLACLVQEKIKIKFLLASLKTLKNSKKCSVSRSVPAFLCSHWSNFSPCTFIASFRNNFEDHRRVTEQLLETQAAIRKPEQALWRGLLEGISQIVSDFIEASRNFYLDFLYKKTTKNYENH
jgi:hypothetical protein